MNKQENKVRSSNFELLRIFAMLGILASHFLGPVFDEIKAPGNTPLADFLLVQATFGKIGISCFMLISGYFMCKQEFTIKKYIRILAQIYFYAIVIQLPLIIWGFIPNELSSWTHMIFPWTRISEDSFITDFLLFYLITPFIRILLTSISQMLHLRLLIWMTVVYVLYSTTTSFDVLKDPLMWFFYLYVVSGYIRFYGFTFPSKRKYRFIELLDSSCLVWGGYTLISVIIVAIVTLFSYNHGYPALRLTGHIGSLFGFAVSFSGFMMFRNMKVKYSKVINLLGGATFGVLLIHTNCNFVYDFIFCNIYDVPHILEYDTLTGISVFCGGVVSCFVICSILEIIRKKYIEPLYMRFIS